MSYNIEYISGYLQLKLNTGICNIYKKVIVGLFLPNLGKTETFPKQSGSLTFHPYGLLTSCKVSEKKKSNGSLVMTN